MAYLTKSFAKMNVMAKFTKMKSGFSLTQFENIILHKATVLPVKGVWVASVSKVPLRAVPVKPFEI
jgi:hypothetical protein